MRRFCLGLLGILCCTVKVPADSYNEMDALIVSKDFPFPPDESDLPENVPSSNDNIGPPQSPQPQKSEKKIDPEVNTSNPKTGKDIFPPEESDIPENTPYNSKNNPKTGKDIFPPEEESDFSEDTPSNSNNTPNTGKDVFPSEKSGSTNPPSKNRNQPRTGKDIFPPEESNFPGNVPSSPKADGRTPKMGKDVFPSPTE